MYYVPKCRAVVITIRPSVVTNALAVLVRPARKPCYNALMRLAVRWRIPCDQFFFVMTTRKQDERPRRAAVACTVSDRQRCLLLSSLWSILFAAWSLPVSDSLERFIAPLLCGRPVAVFVLWFASVQTLQQGLIQACTFITCGCTVWLFVTSERETLRQ